MSLRVRKSERVQREQYIGGKNDICDGRLNVEIGRTLVKS